MEVKRGRPALGAGRLAAVVDGVDRLTTLSDTRFSVQRETADGTVRGGMRGRDTPRIA